MNIFSLFLSLFFIIFSVSLYSKNTIIGAFGFQLGETLEFQQTNGEKPFSTKHEYLINPTETKLKFDEYFVAINPITKEITTITGKTRSKDYNHQKFLEKHFRELKLALTHKYGKPKEESGSKETWDGQTYQSNVLYYQVSDSSSWREIKLSWENLVFWVLTIEYTDKELVDRAKIASSILLHEERKAKDRKTLKNINYLDDL